MSVKPFTGTTVKCIEVSIGEINIIDNIFDEAVITIFAETESKAKVLEI